MDKRKYFIKEAIVLVIALSMILSTSVIAETDDFQTPKTKIEGSGQAPGAIGSVVWDNGMEYENLMATQWDESIDFDSYVADDFHFDEDTTVLDVHWVGGYWGTDYDIGAFDWCISFMYDDGTGESPDGHPQTPTYAGPYCFTWDEITKEVLEDTGTSIYYELSVDLPETITFYGCEKFWISIWAEGQYPPQSGWGAHETYQLSPAVWGSDYFGYTFWTPGFEVQGYDFDMAFQLTSDEGCEPSVDVEKYVWDPCAQGWIDADTEAEAIDLPICTDVQFKIVIHNNGECCGALYDIFVGDMMHDSLKYISSDPEPDEWYYDPPYYYIYWYFPGPLDPCNTIEIYVTAHVEGPDCSVDPNYVEVQAYSDCEPYYVYDWDWAWVHAYENKPPSPPIIDGPNKGGEGVELCWTFHSTDPNGDPVQYIIDWGDGSTDTTECKPSCVPIEVCHTYAERGTYIIKAIAKDCCWGAESTESTLEVEIPRPRTVYHSVFLQLIERFPFMSKIFRDVLGIM
ncbi:MAG: PKD domain-containing protein [Thermoplasmatales archaeon]|nr:MAG: PKD domain-containing protein [Thermoplasmatales archaeon]